jgi:hypothetical protein
MNDDLQEQINELEQTIQSLNTKIINLMSEFSNVKKQLDDERISRGSLVPFLNGIDISGGKPMFIGNGGLAESTKNIDTSSEVNSLALFAGRDRGTPAGGAKENSNNSQIFLQHQKGTYGSTNQTFLFGYRPPLFQNNTESSGITATSGNSTLTDSTQNWTTNELAGGQLIISNSSGSFQFSRQIASNTGTIITIDGTFPSTVSNVKYTVIMPIYFGASQYPWRQGYFGGEDISSGGTGAQRRVLRFGYGTTSGADVIGLYFGTGSPESVVTANVGSLYLRTDGGASTTLYVKETGTSNTGWSVK